MRKSSFAVLLLAILAVSMMSMTSVSAASKRTTHNPLSQPVRQDTVTVAWGDGSIMLPEGRFSGFAVMGIIPAMPHPMAGQGTVSAIVMFFIDVDEEGHYFAAGEFIWQIGSVRTDVRGSATYTIIQASPVYCSYHSSEALGPITIALEQRNGVGTLQAQGPYMRFSGESRIYIVDWEALSEMDRILDYATKPVYEAMKMVPYTDFFPPL